MFISQQALCLLVRSRAGLAEEELRKLLADTADAPAATTADASPDADEIPAEPVRLIDEDQYISVEEPEEVAPEPTPEEQSAPYETRVTELVLIPHRLLPMATWALLYSRLSPFVRTLG